MWTQFKTSFEKLFPTKKHISALIVLLILLFSLPITVYLSQKTTIFKPRAQEASQTHNVVIFDSKIEQNLKVGDKLEGNGIPEAKVNIYISPNGISEDATADTEGKWSYQIPNSIIPGDYNLTITL